MALSRQVKAEKLNHYSRIEEERGKGGYDLIFEEGSEWFEKIDKNDDWNDKEWDEWMKLNCEELKFSVDGKI